ncbi:MAG TPA: hypothetical protein VMT00_14740 [Thermoanaerobaculia bacterium]|nr:hypothetical protein [Thermoanaerobaculia bacterium]
MAATQRPAESQRSEIERALEEAGRLVDSDPLAAARLAEAAIETNRHDPQRVRLQLLAGRARLEHEQALDDLSHSPEAFAQRRRELDEEARAHRSQYRRSQPAGIWLYNGYHFREILRGFPESDLADDAAYELTRLTFAGECEGSIPCHVKAELEPLLGFLERFPQSELAPQAIIRANEAFTNNLYLRGRAQPVPIVDLRAKAAGYDPREVERLLARYTAVASSLPPPTRAHAFETIADLWERMGDREKALELYTFIVRNVPDYPNLDEIGRRIRRLS